MIDGIIAKERQADRQERRRQHANGKDGGCKCETKQEVHARWWNVRSFVRAPEARRNVGVQAIRKRLERPRATYRRDGIDREMQRELLKNKSDMRWKIQ